VYPSACQAAMRSNARLRSSRTSALSIWGRPAGAAMTTIRSASSRRMFNRLSRSSLPKGTTRTPYA
jgi:hypothetical protein